MTLAEAASLVADEADLVGPPGHVLSESAPSGTIATLPAKEFLRERGILETTAMSRPPWN